MLYYLIIGTTNACQKSAPAEDDLTQIQDDLKRAEAMVAVEIVKLGNTRREDKRKEELQKAFNTLGNIGEIVQSSKSEDPTIAFIQGVGLLGDILDLTKIAAKFVPGIYPFLTSAADAVIHIFSIYPKTNEMALKFKKLGHLGQGVLRDFNDYLRDIETFETIWRYDPKEWDKAMEDTWQNILKHDRYLNNKTVQILFCASKPGQGLLTARCILCW